MNEKSQAQVSMSDVLAMLAECFNVPPHDMHAGLQRDAVDGWDSMGALMLMAELDERFGIELTADVSREMKRIGDVLAFLKVHGVLSEDA